MNVLRRISNYWWCQLAGWGLVVLSSLFYANFIKQPITSHFILKMFIIMTGGILSTHLLRWYIRKSNWLFLPVERIFFRLCIAVILTSLLFSLLVMGMNQAAGLEANRHSLDFSTRLFANILNLGIFIIPWVLFYYFYHYLIKTRKQQFDTLKLEALVKELELKTIKAHINPHFIFNALNSIRALIDEKSRSRKKCRYTS